MADGTIDKILEKVPYSDGSFRRRMVAGSIIVIWIFVMNLKQFIPVFSGINSKDLLTSPFLVMIIFVLIYAVGNIIELLGEVFLVRAASGVLWAISFPKRFSERSKNRFKKIGLFIIGLILLPFLITINVLKGFIGHTSYKIHLRSSLGNEAKNLYSTLPDKVSLGLSEPVGDNTEIAWKYLVDQFTSEADQRWARRFIGRTKDVSAITTSAIIIIFIFSLTSVYEFAYETPQVEDKLKIAQEDYYRHREIVADIIYNLLNAQEQLEMKLEPAEHDRLKEITSKLSSELKTLRKEEIIKEKLVELEIEKRRAEYKENAFFFVTTLAFLIPIMLLYIGFFITLRNSIVCILEVLALKETIPVERE